MTQISIIIPAFNAAKTIKRAINSALQQQISHQVILIDDHSSDDTFHICQQFSHHPNVIVVKNQHKGAASARNLGLSLADKSSQYIQFLDADDAIYPDKLKQQSRQMKAQQADVLVGAYRYRHLDGDHSFYYPLHDIWSGLLVSRLGRTSSNLYRRQALQQVNGWNENLTSSQEYDLMFRLLQNQASISFSDTPKCDIFATLGSISHSNIIANAKRRIQLRQQMLNYLQQQQLMTPYRQFCYQQAIKLAEDEITRQLSKSSIDSCS